MAEQGSRADAVRTAVRGVGQLLITVGYVLLLFAAYEVWGTDLINAHDQTRLTDQLRDQWATTQPATAVTPVTVPAVGKPFAVLHVPRLDPDYARTIVEGTDQDQLAQGPGHYTGSAVPGAVGNFAVAGHRVGRGSPFLDLDELRPGDPIVVETADAWYVYRVLGDPLSGSFTGGTALGTGTAGREIVLPTDVDVVAPVPDQPDATATQAYLTLTTCNPKFSARQRLVVHAVLDGAPIARTDDPDGPPALTETSGKVS